MRNKRIKNESKKMNIKKLVVIISVIAFLLIVVGIEYYVTEGRYARNINDVFKDYRLDSYNANKKWSGKYFAVKGKANRAEGDSFYLPLRTGTVKAHYKDASKIKSGEKIFKLKITKIDDQKGVEADVINVSDVK